MKKLTNLFSSQSSAVSLIILFPVTLVATVCWVMTQGWIHDACGAVGLVIAMYVNIEVAKTIFFMGGKHSDGHYSLKSIPALSIISAAAMFIGMADQMLVS